MTDEKDKKHIQTGNEAVEKLFEALDEEQFPEGLDPKSIELALKKVELDLKNIRKALKYYRKKSVSRSSVLKG